LALFVSLFALRARDARSFRTGIAEVGVPELRFEAALLLLLDSSTRLQREPYDPLQVFIGS
jgi:hypothetical protein